MKTTLLFPIKKCFFAGSFLFLTMLSQAQIASWTYEPLQGTISNPLSNSGSGTSAVINLGGGTVTPGTATGMAGTGCGAQSGVTAWALNPFDAGSVNESNGVQFNASTAGYQNIFFTWDQRWSNTAANTVRLQYTTDGATWVSFNMTAANTTFCSGNINANGCFESNTTGDEYRRITVNFSAVSAANNNPSFGIRLLASYYQASGQFRQVSAPSLAANPSGTWRFDNVSFTGTLLPGPTASVITGTTSICTGSSANLKVTITGGTGPFTLIYTDGTTNYTVNNYISASNIPITPATTKTYTIVSVTNANGAMGTGNSGAAVVTVKSNTATVTAANITTCLTGAVAMTGGSPPGGTYSIGSSYSGGTTTFTYSYTDASGCPKVSPTYTFTRNVAPVITTQPSPSGPQTVCQGDPFTTLTVAASGTNLSYQWYRNTTNTTTGGTSLTGATYATEVTNGSKTATFTPLSTAVGTYYYYVIITNPCTSVKSTAPAAGPFTVVSPPIGGTASNDQSLCSDAPADLTVTGFTNAVTKWQYATDFAFTAPVDIPLSAAATLTSAQIGIIATTLYYRAVVSNGICNAYSNVVTISRHTTTWNGSSWSNGTPTINSSVLFTGDYNSTSDLYACSVQIDSGNIIFGNALTHPSHNLIIQNGLTINGGTLTFEHNASLVQVNNSTNFGSITYKRDTTPVRKFDFTYWSSPVDLQILADFSPLTLSDKYFWFNTAIYNWDTVVVPALTPMEIGKGYIIRAPQDFDPVATAVFHGVFTGTPNNGDYTVDIVKNGINDLNCIGNPYPSAVSAKKFIEGNPGAFGSVNPGTTLYFWTHNTAITNLLYTFDDYATYNFTGGVGTGNPAPGPNTNSPDGMIAAGQSFMIKGMIEGTTTATFSNSMREIGNNTQFFRTNQSETEQRHRLWLSLKNSQGLYKQQLVGYVQNATDGFDNGYDGEMLEAGTAVGFYSIVGEKKLTIQGRANNFNVADQILLGFKSNIADHLEISLSDFDGMFENQDVYLEDMTLHTIQNLKDSPYIFDTEAGTFDHRFVLRFTNPNLGITESVLNPNTVIIAKNKAGQIAIDSSVKKMKNIRIYDLLGRLLDVENNLNEREWVVENIFSDATLLISIELTDNQIISKKFSN